MEFIRELISERWIKVKLEGTTSLSITLSLVEINSILGEVVNEVDRSLFANNLAIYITTRNQRVETRELKRVITFRCMSSGERTNILPQKYHTKKPNHTLQENFPVSGDDPRQQMELGGTY